MQLSGTVDVSKATCERAVTYIPARISLVQGKGPEGSGKSGVKTEIWTPHSVQWSQNLGMAGLRFDRTDNTTSQCD